MANLVEIELRSVVASKEFRKASENLRKLLRRTPLEETTPVSLKFLSDALCSALLAHPDKLRVLWNLLEISGDAKWITQRPAAASVSGSETPSERGTRFRGGVVLGVVTASVLAVLLLRLEWQLALLRCFAILVLATLPGWLFLRFIVFRAGALWTEYVLNLHRLGFDQHEYLPEPPATSGYHRLWYESGGSLLVGSPNVYRQKFEAYYGKAVASLTAGTERTVVSDTTLVPVYLSTLIFAAGWTSVLWRDPLFAEQLTMPVDALRFTFMGAYSFVLQMMVRRYFQSDLKTSAYLSAITRIVTALILVAVVYWAVPSPSWMTPGRQCGVAFIIGFFPLVGMQLLQKALTAQARRWLPTLDNPYPLSSLVGLNVWYEARLLEEGIEDMENLISANLVDVLLHTRVPVGRLIDWIDQAHLYLVLEPFPSPRDKRLAKRHGKKSTIDKGWETASRQRRTLRQLGVRGATDLEALFIRPENLSKRGLSSAVLAVEGDKFLDEVRKSLDDSDVKPHVAEAMLKVFANSPGLITVRHWRDVLLKECHGNGDIKTSSSMPAAEVAGDGSAG